MCFFVSFVPATFWAVVGYFVLFTSSRAEGPVRVLGRWLAIWVFIIAGLIPLAAAYITLAGFCPLDALLNAAG